MFGGFDVEGRLQLLEELGDRAWHVVIAPAHLPALHPLAVTAASHQPLQLLSQFGQVPAASSVCLVLLAFWMLACLMLSMAWANWSMPTNCCWLDAAIWIAAWADWVMLSDSVRTDWPASAACCRPGLDRLAALLRGHDGGAGRLLDVVQDRADLGGGLLGLLGQALDFLGHDGEALALFAGLGGFDGRVHGQQVGLGRQIVDGGDDRPDGLALFAQPHDAGRDRIRLLADAIDPADHLLHGPACRCREACAVCCAASATYLAFCTAVSAVCLTSATVASSA